MEIATFRHLAFVSLDKQIAQEGPHFFSYRDPFVGRISSVFVNIQDNWPEILWHYQIVCCRLIKGSIETILQNQYIILLEKALPVLEDLIIQSRSSDPQIAIPALKKLAFYKENSALQAIEDALRSASAEIQQAAIQAIGVQADPRLFKPLTDYILSTQAPPLRGEGIRALAKYVGSFWDEQIVACLAVLPVHQEYEHEIERLIHAIGETATKSLEHYLFSEDENIIRRTLNLLVATGELGIFTLISHAQDIPHRMKAPLAMALAQSGNQNAIGFLLQQYKSEDAHTRSAALHGLRAVDSPEVFEIMCHALSDPYPLSRLDAAIYLAEHPNKRALPYIQEYLKRRFHDPVDTTTRLFCQDALQKIHDQFSSVQELRKRLFTGNKAQRRTALDAIRERLDVTSIPFVLNCLALLEGQDNILQDSIFYAFIDLNAVEVVDLMVNWEDDYFWKPFLEGEACMVCLGLLGHPAALPLIEKLASKEVLNPSGVHHDIIAAREALKNIQQNRELLIRLWYTTPDDLSLSLSLARLGASHGINDLVRAYPTLSRGMQLLVLRALGQRAFRAFEPFLLERLVEEDRELTRQAVLSLGFMGLKHPPAALQAILLDRDEELRTAGLFSLAEIHDPASLPLVLHMLSDPSEQVRAIAVQSLHRFRKVNSEQIISALIKATADPSAWVRLEAVRLLNKMRVKVSTDVLEKLLVDENENTRYYAVLLYGFNQDERLYNALKQTVKMRGRAMRQAKERVYQIEYFRKKRLEIDPNLAE